MSQVIKLKHSTTADAPSTLATAEPAYSEKSNILYIGGTGGPVPIGGKSFVDKLEAIETGATRDQTAEEIATLIEALSNANLLTDTEVAKLAGLESSKFKGTFTGLASLNSSVASPQAGDYADVDLGVGEEVIRCIYDATDGSWVQQAGASNAETSATILAKLLGNSNVHVLSDSLKAKLEAIESGATKDQTGVEIKALLEGVEDFNTFTDTEKSAVGNLGALAFTDTIDGGSF